MNPGRLSVLAVLLVVVAAIASTSSPAAGQAPDYPATMVVERATATAVYLYWQQDYRMLMHCMTQAARAEGALTATARPHDHSAALPHAQKGG